MAVLERLGDGFVLKSVESAEDAARYASFSGRFNGPSEEKACRLLLESFPGARWEDFLFVEREEDGEILATACLIPWQCSYEGIPLRAAMVEMVLSHPGHRRLGLIRLLMERHSRSMCEQGYDLGVIWGIPYYYRQYGYAYCINGNTAEALPSCLVPEAPGGDGHYTIRRAKDSDIPALSALHDAANARLGISVTRDAAHWQYLLGAVGYPVWLVQNNAGDAEGYIVFGDEGNARASVPEHGFLTAGAGLFALQWLKGKACAINVGWPEKSLLAELARSLGSCPTQPGQWLIRLVDIPKFLTRIAPALENRLADAGYGDMAGSLTLNLYRQAYTLRFDGGRLAGAQCVGFSDSSMGADGGDLCVPPNAFTRLAMGFRTIDELTDAWPDIVVRPGSRRLLEALFPRLDSYIAMPLSF